MEVGLRLVMVATVLAIAAVVSIALMTGRIGGLSSMLDNQENSAKCEIWITKGNCTKASSCSWTLDQCNEETEEEFECRDFSTEESCPSECTWSPGVEGREWDGGCR